MTTDTPARQPQKEYIITSKEVDILQRNLSIPTTRILDDIRSRPHTSPTSPDEPDGMKGYPQEMRAWAEACNVGAEEQYIREQREEAAKAAREQVVEDIRTKLSKLKTAYPTGADFVWWLVIDVALNEVKESLRPHQAGEP